MDLSQRLKKQLAAGNRKHKRSRQTDLHAKGKKHCECARSMWRPITALVVAVFLISSNTQQNKKQVGLIFFSFIQGQTNIV